MDLSFGVGGISHAQATEARCPPASEFRNSETRLSESYRRIRSLMIKSYNLMYVPYY